MISISLFLGFHIELNILGTRDISCVLHEIQIWNTIFTGLPMLRYSFGCDCSFVFVVVSFCMLFCLLDEQIALFQWVGEVPGPAAGNSWVMCDRAVFSTSLHQHHHHYHHHFTSVTITITLPASSSPPSFLVVQGNSMSISDLVSDWVIKWQRQRQRHRERFSALVT